MERAITSFTQLRIQAATIEVVLVYELGTHPSTWLSNPTYLQEGKHIHTPGPNWVVQRSVCVLGKTRLVHMEAAI